MCLYMNNTCIRQIAFICPYWLLIKSLDNVACDPRLIQLRFGGCMGGASERTQITFILIIINIATPTTTRRRR
jgi:hypothetical protein